MRPSQHVRKEGSKTPQEGNAPVCQYLLDKLIWPFLFCFVPKTVYGTKFFELFAKVFRIFRPRGNFFDGPKIFQFLADSAAIRLVQKSSKSEPSSPFFGRLKFRGKFVPCELLQNFLCGYNIEMAMYQKLNNWTLLIQLNLRIIFKLNIWTF